MASSMTGDAPPKPKLSAGIRRGTYSIFAITYTAFFMWVGSRIATDACARSLRVAPRMGPPVFFRLRPVSSLVLLVVTAASPATTP
jgi:hypothetical protein